jgi:hypothetical protein
MEGKMEFTLASGAKLSVTEAPYRDTMSLQRSLLSAVKGFPIGDDIMNMDLSVLKDAILSVATSNDVEVALFRCGARATYDDVKVTESLFDDPKMGLRAREDFYEIAWKIIEVNCGPFFKQPFSRLKAVFPGTPTASPR